MSTTKDEVELIFEYQKRYSGLTNESLIMLSLSRLLYHKTELDRRENFSVEDKAMSVALGRELAARVWERNK